MKTCEGLAALVAARDALPAAGWIFVDRGTDRRAADVLACTRFHVPENVDDEFHGEDHLQTWLEVGTFRQVLRLREKRLPTPTLAQYAEAAVHYLVRDDFLE